MAEHGVEVGDLLKDNNPRQLGERVVKVVSFAVTTGGHSPELVAVVENVNHWNEKLIGRRSTVLKRRLQRGGAGGYTRLSH